MTEVRAFLAARTATPVPPTVISLLDDVADRTERFIDRGAMRVIHCAELGVRRMWPGTPSPVRTAGCTSWSNARPARFV